MTERTFLGTWGRRAITVPLYFLLTSLVIATLPASVLFAVGWDLARRTRWAMLRSLGFLTVYLGCESEGIRSPAFCRYAL